MAASCSGSTSIHFLNPPVDNFDEDWCVIGPDNDEKPTPNLSAPSPESPFPLTVEILNQERDAILSGVALKWLAFVDCAMTMDEDLAKMQFTTRFIAHDNDLPERLRANYNKLCFLLISRRPLVSIVECSPEQRMFYYHLGKIERNQVLQTVFRMIQTRDFDCIKYCDEYDRHTFSARIYYHHQSLKVKVNEAAYFLFSNQLLFLRACETIRNFSKRYEAYLLQKRSLALMKLRFVPEVVMKMIFPGSAYVNDKFQEKVMSSVAIDQALMDIDPNYLYCGEKIRVHGIRLLSENDFPIAGRLPSPVPCTETQRRYFFYLKKLSVKHYKKIKLKRLELSPKILRVLQRLKIRNDKELKCATGGIYPKLTSLVSRDALFSDSNMFNQLLKDTNLEEHFLEWQSRSAEDWQPCPLKVLKSAPGGLSNREELP